MQELFPTNTCCDTCFVHSLWAPSKLHLQGHRCWSQFVHRVFPLDSFPAPAAPIVAPRQLDARATVKPLVETIPCVGGVTLTLLKVGSCLNQCRSSFTARACLRAQGGFLTEPAPPFIHSARLPACCWWGALAHGSEVDSPSSKPPLAGDAPALK